MKLGELWNPEDEFINQITEKIKYWRNRGEDKYVKLYEQFLAKFLSKDE